MKEHTRHLEDKNHNIKEEAIGLEEDLEKFNLHYLSCRIKQVFDCK